jgi:FkbH-like protein
MNILFLSDLVMEPLARELKKSIPGEQIISFHEDISAGLLTLDNAKANEQDLILIHTDAGFKKHGFNKMAEVLQQVKALASRVSCPVLMANLIELPYPSGVLARAVSHTQSAWCQLQEQLDDLQKTSNFFWIDLDAEFRQLGYSNVYTFSLGHLYQMPYSKKAIQVFSSLLNEWIQFLNRSEKKVIVLDCDNTLWKGIIGEDGLQGIRCDLSHEGILHYHLQQFLAERKAMGFLLCLCSKNNEADVQEAFETLQMPLKWDDFILKKVNWVDKPGNIQQLASELNVGVDSFIFLDDSDFEVQSVRSMLPGVTVFQIRPDYTSFVELIKSLYFCRKQLSVEDIRKHQQYIEEAARKRDEATFNSMEDYIKSLDIQLDIRCNDPVDFERVSQLTQKTNQFNFNKIAYLANDIEKMVADGNKIYTLRVSDKYGDYGLVGVLFIKVDYPKSATIHNYLMSCRALGRRIEFDFMDYVYAESLQLGIDQFKIEFVKTDRNKPAEDFYLQLSSNPIWQ